MKETLEQRQERLLLEQDPRYLMMGKYGTGLITLTQLYEGTDFVIPSMSALCLNQSLNSHRKSVEIFNKGIFLYKNDNNEYFDDAKNLFDFFEHRISSIINSYTAIEAWANFIIMNNKEYLDEDAKGIEKRNLCQKLEKAVPTIFDCQKFTERPLWNKFQELDKIRHRVIHPKQEDIKPQGDSRTESLWTKIIKTKDYQYYKIASDVISFYYDNSKRKNEPKLDKPRWLLRFPY